MNPPTSEQLAANLDQSFPHFVDAHAPMVLTLATRLTDSHTGQDITQEVFLRAYQAMSGYGRNRVLQLSVRPWLATITRNLVRNEYRRRDRRATIPLDPNEPAATDALDLEAIDADDLLNQMLASLSDPQREAVVLRHVVGLSIRDVALTMAVPEGTAKSHVSRGLDRLRTQLSRSQHSVSQHGVSQHGVSQHSLSQNREIAPDQGEPS